MYRERRPSTRYKKKKTTRRSARKIRAATERDRQLARTIAVVNVRVWENIALNVQGMTKTRQYIEEMMER